LEICNNRFVKASLPDGWVGGRGELVPSIRIKGEEGQAKKGKKRGEGKARRKKIMVKQ
jgi:hypothetical protein